MRKTGSLLGPLPVHAVNNLLKTFVIIVATGQKVNSIDRYRWHYAKKPWSILLGFPNRQK